MPVVIMLIYSAVTAMSLQQCRIYVEAKEAVLGGPQAQGAPQI